MNNIYMVGGISFQTGHGKLKLSETGKKIVPSYPESRKKIGNFNFLRLNYRKLSFSTPKVSLKNVTDKLLLSENL